MFGRGAGSGGRLQAHPVRKCMDGLVYPDRRIHTGLLEYQNVYRPLRLLSYEQSSGRLHFHNYMDFDDAADCVDISYELTQDGILRQKGQLLGFDEVQLDNADGRNQRAQAWLSEAAENAEISVQETEDSILLSGRDFAYAVSRKTGLFTSLCFAGQEYLQHPMELNIWRAPMDNDMYIRKEWEKARYQEAYTRAYQVGVLQNNHGTFVMAEPAFEELGDGFLVTMFRNQTKPTNQTNQLHQSDQSEQPIEDDEQQRRTVDSNDWESRIIELLKACPDATTKEIMNKLEITNNQVKYYIKKLKSDGKIERIGTNRKGSWKVM